MSYTEIAVIVLGLLLGYWLVSFFFASGKGDRSARQAQAIAADGAPPWYQVLQVSADAGPDEIRAAYEAERERYHPDKVRDLAPEFQQLAQRKSLEVEAAYRAALGHHGITA